MAEYVSTVSASRMAGPVRRASGDLGNDHNSTFVTSLMTSLISDAKYQSKLDEYWKEAVALGDENYFNQSLKLLNGLLVSGNMPNLAAATPAGPASSSSVPESSSAVESSSSGTTALNIVAVGAPKMTLDGRTLQFNANGNVRVDVISMTGSVVKTFNKTASGATSVSLMAIPNGLYVVRVMNAGVSTLKKIKLD